MIFLYYEYIVFHIFFFVHLADFFGLNNELFLFYLNIIFYN